MIDRKQGSIWLDDSFRFDNGLHEIDERFVTWLPVTVDGSKATIRGKHLHLPLTDDHPSGVEFGLEALGDLCQANDTEEVLQRLQIRVTNQPVVHVRLRLDILPPGPPDAGTPE